MISKEVSHSRIVALPEISRSENVVAPRCQCTQWRIQLTCSKEEGKECRLSSSTFSSSCLVIKTLVLLCPLTLSAFIASSSKDPNVEYQWTSYARACDRQSSEFKAWRYFLGPCFEMFATGVRTRCCHERLGSDVLLLHES
jgi:hypothetical protein